ncbi:mechanosensitive ion channel family protein [Schaalia suimastitidis]|uniref:mechanosensitive ion channel family protein n=1 Tax=Schaalia suimastitidis TaxID=121163 RepID=UPI00040A74E2|nr:mechanosensitive ion channel family protein [Schaalia suimastitidis]
MMPIATPHFVMELLTPLRSAQAATTTTTETVEATIDVMFLLGASVGGLVIALVIAVLVAAVGRTLTRTSPIMAALVKRVRIPAYFALAVWGAWAGLQFALLDADLATWSGGTLVRITSHVLLIAAILAITWIFYAAAWIFEDAARLRQSSDHGRARRFETQAQILRRLTQVIVVILGIVIALLTFEAARAAMTTILASAGLLSVVAGLAAQQTLGNVFAGLQLAFTDAIRVGDIVVAEKGSDSGAVEEITLGYVVVRIWDERRLIVPSTYFTSNIFENWTRRTATRLGTVELQVDWAAPMALIRSKVEQILLATDLWDGRSWAVQMTANDMTTVTVRVLVSAQDSGKLWDLRCHVREQLIQWINTEAPWVRPVQRIQPQEIVAVPHDTSREEVARLAKELSDIAADETVAPGRDGLRTDDHTRLDSPTALDPVHAARLKAARQRSKKLRRRALAKRQRDLAEGRTASDEAIAGSVDGYIAEVEAHTDPDGTQVLSATAVMNIVQASHATRLVGAEPTPEASGQPADHGDADTQHTGHQHPQGEHTKGERLYSGSPDADERATIWQGPGEEALAEREEVARRRDTREKTALTETVEQPKVD